MISANAKINLFLAITGRHIENYHELIALNVPVSVYDYISINESEQWKFECNDQCLLKNNTIHRAIEQLRPFLSKKYHINLTKNIPLKSGFGGGSSDAVAVLKFLNNHENLAISSEILSTFARNVGTDCSFFVWNRPAIVSGIGDIVSPLEEKIVQALKRYQILIFKPLFGIETKLAYQELQASYKNSYLSYTQAMRSLNNLIKKILEFSPNLPVFNTFSDIVFSQHKELLILRHELANEGINMMLSGSGSGCFCIFQDKSQTSAIIEKIKHTFKSEILIQEVTII